MRLFKRSAKIRQLLTHKFCLLSLNAGISINSFNDSVLKLEI